ncbi:flagellar attachment zone protein 1-like [Thrips palmi]|uniref:Flagellar attachment zone protein 1-like n=1 Tax=Thrips palmi TaxID=161013 RepID=A0A6P8Z9L3_THRPL|nr:flagellar attachment zone protein 1-like [Thrips palmi]
MTDSIDFDQSSAHSLNCGSDFKDVHCNQLQNVAKLSRSDLEDLYYQLHDENIDIKKKFNNLDSKYKVMATRVMRLSRDHKCIDSIDREEDQRQLKQLKQNETALRSKLTVLRGQLTSHTRLHSAALSKAQRPRSHRCSRSCHAEHNICGRDEDFLSDIGHSVNQSRSQSRHRSTSRSTSNQREVGASIAQKTQNELTKANTALREEVAHLQERISTLQKEMVAASEQSQKRILELERELGAHLEQETAENVELIKARRINKQQEGAMISLQQEYQLVQRELQACKSALTLAARDQDEMCSTLMQERQKSTNLQQEIVKLTQACSSMREIQEQLNDAQRENAVLKEHSNRLLQLTTGAADPRTSLRGDPNEVKQNLKSQVSLHEESTISEENSVIEKRLESLKLQQSRLQNEISNTQAEVADLRGKILDSKEERNALRDEHTKVQSECLKLRMELSDPNEERKKLSQQLIEVRSECNRLAEELSKSKSDLEQKLQEQQQLQQRSQEVKAGSEFKEMSSSTHGSNLLASPILPLSNRPVFHTPQLTARTSQFLTPTHPHSHPSTPRPRVGDACLALLEQTAIRQPSVPFPGVLGSHCSLQERFLELCIPTSSVSSSSTPVPPPSVFEGESTTKGLPNTAQENKALVPEASVANARLSPQFQVTSGNSDTQWELDKCRELLRVQFNLNSIYKKEVASLSNIVQNLTSGSQDASK